MNRTLVPCMAVVVIILMSATAHFRKVQAQSAKALQEARTATIAYQPKDDKELWAYNLATRLGNAQPDYDTIAFLVAWQRSEGTQARYNPLATSQPMPGSTTFNSDGVQEYQTAEDGLTATVLTLQAGHAGYSEIVAGIQTNDPARALAGLARSPWGTNAANVAQMYNREPVSAPANDIRVNIITLALAQVGKPYVLGTEGPDTFDCSGLVQYVYAHNGIATTRTTFTQLDALPAIDPSRIRPGDMIYFQYPWDQHTGILADVDGDGRWDMIHAAAPGLGVIVTSDVFNDPFYASAIIGYRTAIGD